MKRQQQTPAARPISVKPEKAGTTTNLDGDFLTSGKDVDAFIEKLAFKLKQKGL